MSTPCLAYCGPVYNVEADLCGLGEGHPGRCMPKDPVLRHGLGCAYAFTVVGPRGTGTPLSARLCICDPYGDKARAKALIWDQYRRQSVLWQDEVWFQEDGQEVLIKDMSLDRMQALILFLERRAPRLKASWEASVALSPGVQGEHALDAVDQMLTQSFETDPLPWLHETPLVQRLDRRIRKQRRRALRHEFEVIVP